MTSLMKRIAGREVDRVVLGLFMVAAVLLLANLGNGYLWQDEAETAVLARNTLAFGYPRASDGTNIVEAGPFRYGPGQAWTYSPWLSYYLLASVFAVFGESTWVARLPFALLGFLSIYLTWRLARRLTDDVRIHRLSVALLTCSVPFLLHMRQCRYYSLTTALLLGMCLSYLTFFKQPSARRAFTLSLVLVLLFHANFGVFVPACAALIGHQLMWGRTETRQRSWIVATMTAALTVPWAVFFYQPAFVGTISLARVADHAEYYVRITNKFLVPLAFMGLGSVALWWAKQRARPLGGTPPRRPVPKEIRWFLILLVGAHLAFLLLPDQRHMRYVIPIFPVLVIGQAWWLTAWLNRSRLVGWGMAGLMLFTNVLHSPHARIPLAAFAYELTHHYTGPMEGIVDYLQVHGRSEDVAKIPYDDRTLMFYTNVQVERPSRFLHESYPEWVIIRRGWIPQDFFASHYFDRIQEQYERIELDAPDVYWQNREDPGSHHFRTVQDAPRVVIYRKKEAT